MGTKAKTKTYEMIWRNKWLTAEAKSVDDMVKALASIIDDLRELEEAGLDVDFQSAGDDYIFFRTTDPDLAKKFGMYEIEDEE